MNIISSDSRIASAENILITNADEAQRLLTKAFARLLTLLHSLSPEDWLKPTACTAWNVHDIVAHQAGGYLSGVSYKEMFRQYARIPKRGQLPEDAINEFQVNERKNKTHQTLIDELNRTGSQTIHNWAYGFNAIKWIVFPHPVAGFQPFRYLMWITHSRDTWMHRLDICRATNRPFEQTHEHDGRIVELVIRDVAKKLNKKLSGKSFILSLKGIAGGTWKIGKGEPIAEMEMDALDFNIFVSGRYSHQEGMRRAKVSGDANMLKDTFQNFLVLY